MTGVTDNSRRNAADREFRQERLRVRAGRRPLELAMADYYRRQGYAVTYLADDGRDADGLDLLLRLGDRTAVVACRERLPPHFHHELQALQRRLPRMEAGVLIVATLGAFEARSREIADRSPNLQLLDGLLLRILLGDARMDQLQRGQGGTPVAGPAAAKDDVASSAKHQPGLAIVSLLLVVLALALVWLELHGNG
ncbi:MAG: restriction endonuclease [Pseudoxanthomonas sp.]